MNGSMFLRNMVVQEGPLSVPREERTMEHPNFRIIDFGRGTSFDTHGWTKFEAAASNYLEEARRQLVLDQYTGGRRVGGYYSQYWYAV